MTKTRFVKIANQWDFITGVLCFVIGILLRFVIIPMTIHNSTTSIVNSAEFFSDASFVPKIWAICIIVFSFATIIESLAFGKKATEVEVERVDVSAFKETALYCLLLTAVMSLFVFLLPLIGFVLDAALLVSLSLVLFGYRNLLGGVIIVVASTLIVYFVWVKLLYVYFPAPVFPFPLV